MSKIIKLELPIEDVSFVQHILEFGIKNGKVPVEITDEKGNKRTTNMAKECLRIDESIQLQLETQVPATPIKKVKKK